MTITVHAVPTAHAGYIAESVPRWFHALVASGRAASSFNIICRNCGVGWGSHSGSHCPQPGGGFSDAPNFMPILTPEVQEWCLAHSIPIQQEEIVPKEAASVEAELATTKASAVITVKVSKTDRTGRITITPSSIACPTQPEIYNHLAKRQREVTDAMWGRGWQNTGYISNSQMIYANYTPPISAKDWADAIASAILIREHSNGDEATSVVDALSSKGAYLAVDNTIFRLSAESHSRTPALSIMRRNILERAKSEAEEVKAVATKQAKEITAKAQLESAKAQKLITEAKKIIPTWLLTCGYPVRYGINHSTALYDQLEIGLFCTYKPQLWEYVYSVVEKGVAVQKIRKWGPPAKMVPVPTILWVPVDAEGNYVVTNIHTDDNHTPSLPHVYSQALCGTIAAAPKQLKTPQDIAQLNAGLQRALEGVNLNSLLQSACYWGDDVRKCCPPKLLKALLEGTDLSKVPTDSDADDAVFDLKKEEKTEFRV